MSASCAGGSRRNEATSSQAARRPGKLGVRHPFRRRSVRDLSPLGKVVAYLILGLWALVVLFPLYWLAITSFKLPIKVNKGPVYLPFVDFHPTLDAWHYIFVDLRDDTLRPYVNSVVVAVGSSVVAMLFGSTAAYALIRFPYRRRFGLPGLPVDHLAAVEARPGCDLPDRLRLRLERVPARAVPVERKRPDDAAHRGCPERDPGPAVVVHVRADPDHDPSGYRAGDRARAGHLARPARRGSQGVSGAR